jgi:hypothetical protein
MERLQVTADKTPTTVGDRRGLTSVVDRSLIESRSVSSSRSPFSTRRASPPARASVSSTL